MDKKQIAFFTNYADTGGPFLSQFLVLSRGRGFPNVCTSTDRGVLGISIDGFEIFLRVKQD